MVFPSGLNATQRTVFSCAIRLRRIRWVAGGESCARVASIVPSTNTAAASHAFARVIGVSGLEVGHRLLLRQHCFQLLHGVRVRGVVREVLQFVCRVSKTTSATVFSTPITR